VENYRSTEQLLVGHEQFSFGPGIGAYKGWEAAEAFRVFVDRFENAISSENAAKSK
jgi:hypothetical protein